MSIPQRFTYGLALTGMALALSASACGSDGSDEGSGGSGGSDAGAGGAGTTSTITGSPASTGQGGGPGPDCAASDSECLCNACVADLGTCLGYCNYPPYVTCYFPEPVTEGTFSCGGAITCSEQEACVLGTPQGDGCDTYACAALPADCVESPTCECALQHIEAPAFVPSCEEENGNLIVSFPGGPPDPAFVEGEVCGEVTCDVSEYCVTCDDAEFPGEFRTDQCVLDEVPAGSFRCGTTTCLEGAEYCDYDPGFEPCGDSYRCQPLPDCKAACDCIDLSSCSDGTCSADADGNVFVECGGLAQ